MEALYTPSDKMRRYAAYGVIFSVFAIPACLAFCYGAAYIARSADLVRPKARTGRSPANGEPIMLQPPADTVVAHERCENAFW